MSPWIHRDKCQANISRPCQPNPCKQEGKCKTSSDGKSFLCDCKDGYGGEDCLYNARVCIDAHSTIPLEVQCLDSIDGPLKVECTHIYPGLWHPNSYLQTLEQGERLDKHRLPNVTIRYVPKWHLCAVTPKISDEWYSLEISMVTFYHPPNHEPSLAITGIAYNVKDNNNFEFVRFRIPGSAKGRYSQYIVDRHSSYIPVVETGTTVKGSVNRNTIFHREGRLPVYCAGLYTRVWVRVAVKEKWTKVTIYHRDHLRVNKTHLIHSPSDVNYFRNLTKYYGYQYAKDYIYKKCGVEKWHIPFTCRTKNVMPYKASGGYIVGQYPKKNKFNQYVPHLNISKVFLEHSSRNSTRAWFAKIRTFPWIKTASKIKNGPFRSLPIDGL